MVLDFDVNNLGKVMTQTQTQNFLRKMKPMREYHLHRFDGRLADFMMKMIPHKYHHAVRESLRDEKCSKQFQHPNKMMDHVAEFEKADMPNMRYHRFVRAATVLVRDFMLPKGELLPLAIDRDFDELITNKSGAAGGPWTGSKQDNKDELIETARTIKRLIAEGEDFANIFIPAVSFHRSQISGFYDGLDYTPDLLKIKDRLVIGVDGATVLVEAQFAKPMYTILKEHCENYVGGKDPATVRMYIAMIRRVAWTYLGLDYSKFDMHIPAWLISLAFDILRDKYLQKCTEMQRKEWEWIKYNFIHTHLLGPDGKMHVLDHGIKSGSNFTQIIGTVCQWLMDFANIAASCEKRSVREIISYIIDLTVVIGRGNGKTEIMLPAMGDDGLIGFNAEFEVVEKIHEKMVENAILMFGVSLNDDKSALTPRGEYPEFLKRQWRDGAEYQDVLQIVINVVHNERERTYEGYDPIHIFYGLYLTYSASFPGVRERDLIEMMDKTENGTEAFGSLPMDAVPGVFRGMGENVRSYLMHRAKGLKDVA